MAMNYFPNYIKKLEYLYNHIEYCIGDKTYPCEEAVLETVDLLSKCKEQGKQLMWIGNGGSAAIASHAAIDYWRTAGIKSVAFNDSSLLTCISNDFGYANVFVKPLEVFASAGDVLIAISSSGKSENIINAVEFAKQKGCKVVTLSGFSENNPLRTLGQHNYYVPSQHYGQVELTHSMLCHSFLDIYMIKNYEQKW